MTVRNRWLAAALVPMALAACPGQRRAEKPENDAHEQQVAAFAQKRAQHAKELSAMAVPQLSAELRAESMRGLEPFNSMAYREAVSRGRNAAAGLRAELKEPTRASFLGLLAVRAVDSTQYRSLPIPFRVAVLLDALRNARFFNAWGMPHVGWEDAARALIAEGRAAEPGLTALLEDRRPAPSWGSEQAVESQRYGYRVRDYAWALLQAIRGAGPQPAIPVDPAARDSLIAGANRPR